jgi:hypothetical protein
MNDSPATATIETLQTEAEALTDSHRRQGWTKSDFARQLSRILNGTAGGRAALFIESAERVLVGSTVFSLTEASYVRAFAGNALSGDGPSSPVGIDDDTGKRWLLSAGSKAVITLQRGSACYKLRPAQVMRAFMAIFG